MISFSFRHARFVRTLGLCSMLTFLAAPVASMAGTPSAPAPQPSAEASAQQLQQKYIEVRTALAKIEAKATNGDQSLAKKRVAFRKQLIAVMKKNGNDPQPMIASLHALGKQLQDKSLKASKREELIGKARKTQIALVTAERKAMQDPKLQTARKDLQDSTLAAMRKADPRTDKLLAELRSIETQIIKAHTGKGQ